MLDCRVETASDRALGAARASYEAGEFRSARDAAVAGLAARPDDPALLRLAGAAGLEIGDEAALGHLERAVDVAPDDAENWRALGDGLASAGRMDDAGAAFRRAAELVPTDARALVDLGHAVLGTGHADEAVSYFEQALEYQPDDPEALHALVLIHRRAGRLEDALAVALELGDVAPDDVLAALEGADLALELNRPAEARAAFQRARTFDDDPEHDVYAYHGLIEVEVRGNRWRRALDLAIDATRVDRHGRTTELLAFIVAQVFGEADRPAPTRAGVDHALAVSRGEHRRLHEEALVVL
jgi:tetratricopeptide (TPR) repeat protein